MMTLQLCFWKKNYNPVEFFFSGRFMHFCCYSVGLSAHFRCLCCHFVIFIFLSEVLLHVLLFVLRFSGFVLHLIVIILFLFVVFCLYLFAFFFLCRYFLSLLFISEVVLLVFVIFKVLVVVLWLCCQLTFLFTFCRRFMSLRCHFMCLFDYFAALCCCISLFCPYTFSSLTSFQLTSVYIFIKHQWRGE